MEGPREVDIDTFQCPEELLESVEDLQYKVEELQVYCQESEKKNAELQQKLIDRELEFKRRLAASAEELSKLRDTKVHIVRENIMKECAITPRWFNALTKSVEQEKRIKELTGQVDDLSMELMEKLKTIASLEWKVKDCEATIVVLTSDRNRLAVEIDDMALRIEEFEYAENFGKKDSGRSQTESASFDSFEEDAMSYSDKPSGLHSRTSFYGEEEPDNLLPLKRAAHFRNINALDEAASFEIEQENLNAVGEFVLNKDTACQSNERNNNLVGSCEESFPVDTNTKNINKEREVGKDKRIDKSVRRKDTSWEKFDRSDSTANLSKRGEAKDQMSQLGTDRGKSILFEMESSPFTQLLESTPMSKDDQPKTVNDEKSHLAVEEVEAVGEDPWASPAVSPIVEKKSKSISRNLFWEKNTDCTIYPFYLPNESDEESDEPGGTADVGLTEELSAGMDEDMFSQLEPFKDKIDLASSMSLPPDFSFDENALPSTEDGEKPASVFVKKASRENLWDFEPDSIVDVSTGQTIFESITTGKDSDHKPKTRSSTEAEEVASKQLGGLVAGDEEDEPPPQLHGRTKSDTSALTSSRIDKKARSETVNGDASEHETFFIKKGSKKEREALKRYIQWKSQGKQGMPTANFKISLC